MKSFVAYPFELDIILNANQVVDKSSGKIAAHYELFKKVRHLNGAVVKCGITAEEGFARFAMFRSLAGHRENQKIIAFQKNPSFFEEEITASGEVILKVKTKNAEVSPNNLQNRMIENSKNLRIDFVPGNISDSIPDFLIEHAELKIAMLNIDLDDYEATSTALEYLHPRLVEGGVLIFDNYHKNTGERKAADDYFKPSKPGVQNFSVHKGPHYLIKQ